MAQFLVEIHSEEVPAKIQSSISQKINDLFCELFIKEKISFKKEHILNFHCDSKIFFAVQNLEEFQIQPSFKKRGPKINADEKQISGFLRAFEGYKTEDLIQDNQYFYLKVKEKKISTQEVLERITLNVLEKISYSLPKKMKWLSDQKVFWIRPIRNLIAIFNEQILDIKFIDVTANNSLIFENRQIKPLKITSIEQYLNELEKNFIIIDQNQRRKIIEDKINHKVENLGYKLITDNQILIDEIVGIANFPIILEGRINEKFLHLPKEILQLTMVNHQKFICLQDKNGNIAHKFIFIANKTSDKFDEMRIIKENEKILTARLDDAKFFIEEDLKIPLEQRAKQLEKIIFHANLGSMADKVARIEALNKFISLWVSHSNISLIHNISLLSKADLTSKAVAEFTQLQGVMGAYYAKQQGYDEQIFQAIKEHYLPSGPNSAIPQTPLGCLLSISDKLDSVCGLFLADQKPTSSKDPFAIRRSTLGIIRIISENQIQFLLKFAIRKNLKSFSKSTISSLFINKNKKEISQIFDKVTNEIIEFFLERLRFFLKEKNIDLRVINQILSQIEIDNKNYNLLDIINKADFISSFMKIKSNQQFLEVNKRISNILQNYDSQLIAKPRKKYLQNSSEYVLFRFQKEIKSKIKKPFLEKNYKEIFVILTQLTVPATNFLDNNRIEDDDEDIRYNRVAILMELKKVMDKIFDFSKIE